MVQWTSWTGVAFAQNRAEAIWDNVQKNNLWKRMIKNVTATMIAVIICLIPNIPQVYGRAAYLAPMTTVFGHPGRRLGQMVEALIFVAAGALLGIAWATLGVYLGSLVITQNPPAGYAIRAIFLLVAVLAHGFLRSHTPRLFLFVLLLIITSVISLTSPATHVTAAGVTQLVYPVFTAMAILLLVNLCIFPEFSSGYLGRTTIETLDDAARTIKDTGAYFGHVSQGPKSSGIPTKKEKLAKPLKEPSKPEQATPANWWEKIIMSIRRNRSHAPERATATAEKQINLKDLTAAKPKLRSKLAGCKATQLECNYELAYSHLPPRKLKFISDESMKKLIANTIALIGACESKFAMMDEETGEVSKTPKPDENSKVPEEDEDTVEEKANAVDESQSEDHLSGTKQKAKKTNKLSRKQRRKEKEKYMLELVKPRREIEFADIKLFRYLMRRVSRPIGDLQQALDGSVQVVITCIAYVYDVPRLPSGAKTPSGIVIPELDVYVDNLIQALNRFDKNSRTGLESVTILPGFEEIEMDVMPREEIFLVSSFLLNLRQAAAHVLEMLRHCRSLVEERDSSHHYKRLYAPHIQWQKWLYSGGENYEDASTAKEQAGRKGAKDDGADDDDQDGDIPKSTTHKTDRNISRGSQNEDLEYGQLNDIDGFSRRSEARKVDSILDFKLRSQDRPRILSMREKVADFLESTQNSDDFAYAFKLAVAVFLVTWPAFVPSMNQWFYLNRGLWASLQLIFVAEVAIGASVWTFILRSVGTTLGCIWGYAAYEARGGNRIVCAAMIFIGLIPSAYVQLGTQYMRAGMVCIVSMAVVALSTELKTVPGTATDNFLKRWIAFLIGGMVALIVEVVLFPAKARTRMVEYLASAISNITEMEGCIAYGIESRANVNVFSPIMQKRFEKASGRAKSALRAAEGFLPFCSQEPRLKGSFEALALVYREIIFVLHQIVDRMDNMLQLRTAYGSGVLENFNSQIYAYRRNLAASINIILFAVYEALTTKLPLPQFLPSARLAQLRMINRVREVVTSAKDEGNPKQNQPLTTDIARRRAVRQKFLSWNAGSAAQAEVVEYLEELIDLSKLLVGANEFRSGMLLRPTYREYIDKSGKESQTATVVHDNDVSTRRAATGLTQRKGRRGSVKSDISAEDDVPTTLKRIQSRRSDARLERKKTNESAEKL
ncbi:hypothetical protein L228DRAFT_280426 [Xylona heveae TC161]|uniref:ER transporter 6TM N-terminal domain-containing protein n=1 Tax=Xylona heveae (strain CBS 132557 / TC161) TaxID=1328760 RepID=A0A165INV7_XYLHT|nr:hypothetical protein L228DRAFT_280426 [Xylona heveae TC161]KZF25170.1 hypothetical protein L228DRAFT_280426 [Xylona heveae TC161]